jgi:hypothetical protein
VVSFQLSNRNVPCSAATGGGLGLGAFGLRGIYRVADKCHSLNADRRQQGKQSLLLWRHEAKKMRGWEARALGVVGISRRLVIYRNDSWHLDSDLAYTRPGRIQVV